MNIETITPTTVDGIKRLARRRRKEQGMPLHQALDLAARQAGFPDFIAAQRRLSAADSFLNVRITAHFSENGARRTLVAHVKLNQGLRSLARSGKAVFGWHSAEMRLLAEDHLALWLGRRPETVARHDVGRTARRLQFIDATGLRASTASIYGRSMKVVTPRLPSQDHMRHWRDPERKAVIMMDEPYGYADETGAERGAWARTHGFVIRRLDWGGIYMPKGGGVCDLIAREADATVLDAVIGKIGRAAPCFSEEGDAVTVYDGVHDAPTPGELAEREAKARRNAAPRPAARHGASISYGEKGRRPAGALPLERHAQIGRLLHQVRSVVLWRRSALNPVDALGLLLENWASLEAGRTVENEVVLNLYSGDATRVPDVSDRIQRGKPDAALKRDALAWLEQVREWLIAGYPDGVGRDRALKLLDKAAAAAESMPVSD